MKPIKCWTCGKLFVPDHPARRHHAIDCKRKARAGEMRRWRAKRKILDGKAA